MFMYNHARNGGKVKEGTDAAVMKKLACECKNARRILRTNRGCAEQKFDNSQMPQDSDMIML